MNRAMIFKEEVLDSDGHTLYVEHFSNSMVILPSVCRAPRTSCRRTANVSDCQKVGLEDVAASLKPSYVRFHKREDVCRHDVRGGFQKINVLQRT